LCGYPPFEPENGIIELEFPEEEWRNISQQVQDLISVLLDKDPAKRPTAKEVLKHPWVMGETAKTELLVSTISTMKQYNEWRKSVINPLTLPEIPGESDTHRNPSGLGPIADGESEDESTAPASPSGKVLPAKSFGIRNGFRRFREVAMRRRPNKGVTVSSDMKASSEHGGQGSLTDRKSKPDVLEKVDKAEKQPKSPDSDRGKRSSKIVTKKRQSATGVNLRKIDSDSGSSHGEKKLRKKQRDQTDESGRLPRARSSSKSPSWVAVPNLKRGAPQYTRSPRSSSHQITEEEEANMSAAEIKKYYHKRVKRAETERESIQERVSDLEDQVLSLSNINVALQSQLDEMSTMLNKMKRERDEARKERDETLHTEQKEGKKH